MDNNRKWVGEFFDERWGGIQLSCDNFGCMLCNGGAVGSDQTICSGGNPAAFTQSTGSTGSGTLSYQWQSSLNNSSFSNIGGATATTYDPPSGLSQTTYYRRVTTNTLNGGTCAAISNTVTVTVNSVTGGGVGSSQTICSGGDPVAFTQSAGSTGSGTLSYQWQSSLNNSTFSNVSGATASLYDPPSGLSQTTYYKRITTSTLNGVACPAPSNTITVTVNSVTGGAVGSNQTICNGGDPVAFTQGTGSTGSGILSYQWQSSLNNSTFTNISGATATTYDRPSGLSQTTYYKLVTTSTLNGVGCTAPSNTITVTINSVSGGGVDSDQTICSGGNPAAFTSTASTGSGTLSYQWQSSLNNSTFAGISGATGSIYDPPSGLSQTTYYKRVTTSTLNSVACTATSNTIAVTVNSVTGGGVDSDQTICSGGDPAVFTQSTASTGSGTLSYQWQSSLNNSTFANVSGATASLYDPPSGLSQTTYYKRATTSTLNGVACTGPSNTITVTVNSVTGGGVASSQNICSGGDPAAFTQSTVSTGSGALSYQWQSSLNNSTFTNISGATGTNYDVPSGLLQTIYYKRITSSTLNTVVCTATSNTLTVTVDDPSPPNNSSYQFCEWDAMSLTASPRLANLKWYNSSNQLLFTGIFYSPQDLEIGTYTYNVKNVSVAGCEGTLAAAISLTVKANCDEYINWTESTIYGNELNPDQSQKPIAASRSYLDGFGNLMQSQQKSFQSNQVFASQVVNDNNGIPALSTLPAPINSSTFQYRHRFITNNSSPSKQKYSASDFDAQSAPGSRDDPNPVGNNGPGTLGWYYSSANNLEPSTPVTSFPYSRSWAEAGPDSKTAKSAGPGDPYRMGSTHEVKSEKQKIPLGELAHYYRIRTHFVNSAPASAYENLLAHVSTTATTYFSANQNVTIASAGGYINVTCNQNTSTPGVYPIGGLISVTPGATYTYRVKGFKNSARLANLYVAKGTGGNIVWPGVSLPTGGIANENWVSVSFTVPAGITSVRVGVLWSQPLVGETFSLSGVELYGESPGAAPGYKHIVTDPNGKQIVTFTDTDERTLATATLNGTVYDNWSYSFYNALGWQVAAVAPKGVVIGVNTLPQYVTYFKYDHLGRVIETTSPDEGTTQYVYSSDGLLRFSQNQEQRNAATKRFSYTNYDKLGRLIESGEYTCSGTNPYVFQPHTQTPTTYSVLNLIDNTGFTGVSREVSAQASRCSDYTYVFYDVQAPDFPDAATTSQENLFGEVSKTQNANAISWYSYDEFHQLQKSWQKIIPMNNAIKIVDYTYDYYGNVTEVAYQRAGSEGFYHHYEYNKDQALTKVETSLDGATRELRAEYFYYLHGPLKRVELGGNIQGIDYVYGIDGSLKLINHADPALDPGLDGISGANASFMNDVFGEALDYNLNDYTGAVDNEGTFTLDAAYPDQFGGAVKAIRWHNHVDGHTPRAYAFKYDNLYQLDQADWGNMTGAAGSYGFVGSQAYLENIGKAGVAEPYDKNGNILGLVRKGKTGNSLASYEYNYTANTNKLATITPVGGGSAILSYQYNAIGQMTQQTEGSNSMTITYNAMGIAKEIKNASGPLITSYTYDDRGDLVLKTSYNNGTAAKNTFYVSDASGNVMAIYEQTLPSGPLQVAEVPVYGSGRLALYKPAVSTVFYEISDHQGNVRNVIGNPEVLPPYLATLEDNGQANVNNPRVQELAYFENLAATAVQDANMNHTAPSSAMPSPIYSAYLKWISGMAGQDASDKSVGPAIGLKVESGDKIDIETWAKFKNKASYGRSGIVGAMASILGNSFVGTQSGLDVVANATQIFQNGLTYAVGVAGNGSDPNTRPYAYVYYLLYDRSFNFITAGWKRVTSAAGFDAGMEAFSTHEKLTIPTVNITEPGYIYILVANESENTEVWFDDLKIVHERSIVVAGADYYPFGLVMENREITREDYRFGYQGQFSEKDVTTGMQEFELRMYDARIGRWTSPDPYGQFASPYLGMANTPNISIDPDGGCVPPCILLQEVVITAASEAGKAISTAALTVAQVGRHIGNRLANGAVKTGNDFKQAFLNSGYFANSALHTITFNTWPKWKTPGASHQQQAYLQSAGQGFGEGVHVASAAGGGLNPRPAPVLATPTANIPITQPVVVNPSATMSRVHQLNAGKSLNQLNKDVQAGRAPRGIKRFDKGRGTQNLPEDEVHFDDGSSLYRSGKWRHNKGHILTNEQIKYLKENGWTLPE